MESYDKFYRKMIKAAPGSYLPAGDPHQKYRLFVDGCKNILLFNSFDMRFKMLREYLSFLEVNVEQLKSIQEDLREWHAINYSKLESNLKSQFDKDLDETFDILITFKTAGLQGFGEI